MVPVVFLQPPGSVPDLDYRIRAMSTTGQVLAQLHERDRRDKERSTSPLVKAADAVVVDSTAMEPEEVARLVVMLAKDGAASATTT